MTAKKWVCIHEAAHAVHSMFITWTMGIAAWELHEVTINATGRYGGHTLTSTNKTRAALRHRIVNFLVGVEAERHITGRAHGVGFWDDIKKAERLIERVHGSDDYGEKFQLYRKQARLFVREHREHIERVADVLQTRGRLTGHQVADLILGAPGALDKVLAASGQLEQAA